MHPCLLPDHAYILRRVTCCHTLDYHKTVENYLKAKKKFFDDMPKNAFSLTNLDDKNGLVMTQNTPRASRA